MPTYEQVGIIISVIMAGSSFLWCMFYMGMKFSKLQERVDLMWDFLMRRAMSLAITNGYGEVNSPFKINTKSEKLFANLKDELQAFYTSTGKNMTDGELMLEIEKQWGNKILKEICIPHNMTDGECLVIAAAIAKKNNGVKIKAK